MNVTKKYGNLIMCYVYDVMIATNPGGTPRETGRSLYGMKKVGLKSKHSKCEILRD